ncbi:MAG: hypothetical protein LUH01_16530 [Parabacteroides gordonii]|nr:hypothetical protein [Parabacteroides gordonii]
MMEEADKYLDAFRTTLPVLIDKEMNKVRKQQRGLIGLVCVLLATNLLLLGGAMWILLAPKTETMDVTAAPVTEEMAEETKEEVPVFIEETVAEPEKPVMTSDDPLTASAMRAADLAAQRSRAEQRVRQADAAVVDKKTHTLSIPAYVLTERGMTLRSLARRYYGNEVFWVCIYDRNMDALSSPDILPLGIRLKLPRPADYGIDATDPSSLQRARKLGRSLQEQ